MKTRGWFGAAALGVLGAAGLSLALALVLPAGTSAQERAAARAAPKKVLKVAFSTAETSFDPVQISDLYSRTITPHIFEGLYRYDHLARPAKIRPLTADGMPEVSADWRSWTVRVRPGIYFADDPAFQGQRRELTARDYVYSILRTADPANRSELWTYIASQKIEGLAEKRQQHLDTKTPFDYAAEPSGLRTLDRYTLQIRLAEPNPRFLGVLASSDLLGAVAREVVEFYGDKIGEHPVGTGPFRLKSWRRSSMIVLERNPDYRERFYDEQPGPDDAEGQAIAARLRGQRIPIVDEVQVSIIEEDQPMWLSFLNGEIDALASKYGSVPGNFVVQAMPGGEIAPNLAKKGIQGRQSVNPDIAITYFNMEDPVVGGYTPEKVALRRAIGLAMDIEREIRVIRRGQAIPAQSNIVPFTTGYDPAFKSESGDHDPARAKALLDLYGWVDRDGDGWREQPDGAPLELVKATQPEQIYRQFDELFRKNMEAVGIKVRFETGQWPEHLKKARAGRLQIWALGSSAAGTDGQSALYRLHGLQAGSQNLARFRLPEFDAVYDRLSVLPDGPEREALFLEAKKIATAYMPYKPTVHRISTDLWYPWLIGYRRPTFWNEFWHLVDVDPEMRARALQ
jgi:ABC-type transport system substrate-binding protein